VAEKNNMGLMGKEKNPHPPTADTTDGGKEYMCLKCGLKFQSSSQMREHIQTHLHVSGLIACGAEWNWDSMNFGSRNVAQNKSFLSDDSFCQSNKSKYEFNYNSCFSAIRGQRGGNECFVVVVVVVVVVCVVVIQPSSDNKQFHYFVRTDVWNQHFRTAKQPSPGSSKVKQVKPTTQWELLRIRYKTKTEDRLKRVRLVHFAGVEHNCNHTQNYCRNLRSNPGNVD